MALGLDSGSIIAIIAYLSPYMKKVHCNHKNDARICTFPQYLVDLKMRLIDLLVMQGDDLGLFSSLFLVHVGSLYGGVHVPHVTRIYLVVLSQHLEHLTMEVCVGMLHYNKIKEFIGKKAKWSPGHLCSA